MVFGMSEKQKMIVQYLYRLKDTPEPPADSRRSVEAIARNLGMTQREVNRECVGLKKKDYVSYMMVDRYRHRRQRHYSLTPRAIREIEKREEVTSRVRIGTKEIGWEKEKREEK